MTRADVEAYKTLWNLIREIRTAMMTTVDDGVLRARPMRGRQDSFEGTLWFFSRLSSHKSLEIQKEQQVNLTYSDPAEDRYVSVSGTAALVRDTRMAETMWTPFVASWFPQGLDDPELALIKVNIERAEYWDGSSREAEQLLRLAQTRTGQKAPKMGEHKLLDLSQPSSHRGNSTDK